jgi:hypothetical protein
MRAFVPMMLLACVAWSPLALADDGSAVIDVNPTGRPKGIAKGRTAQFFVWHDAEGWHLQTHTAERRHVFTGTIEVMGGKVTKITNFENLEGRKKIVRDLGLLNQAENEIQFRFATKGGRDGFDFQVDESAKQIRFRLLIDGQAAPRRVVIGARGQPSPNEVFMLPAHPE